MSSVTGYVFTGADGKEHFSLDVSDARLIVKLRKYLIDAASLAMDTPDYRKTEEYLHDANHLCDLIGEAERKGEEKAEAEAEAEEGSEVEE